MTGSTRCSCSARRRGATGSAGPCRPSRWWATPMPGKSTLFNRLTAADAYAADQLFATLDPTVRRLRLAAGLEVALADTVGFVRDLPHELVAAFRSTLQEARDADLLLHVIDAADPERAERIAQVDRRARVDRCRRRCRQIAVYNKIDRTGEDAAHRVFGRRASRTGCGCRRRAARASSCCARRSQGHLGRDLARCRVHVPARARTRSRALPRRPARCSPSAWTQTAASSSTSGCADPTSSASAARRVSICRRRCLVLAESAFLQSTRISNVGAPDVPKRPFWSGRFGIFTHQSAIRSSQTHGVERAGQESQPLGQSPGPGRRGSRRGAAPPSAQAGGHVWRRRAATATAAAADRRSRPRLRDRHHRRCCCSSIWASDRRLPGRCGGTRRDHAVRPVRRAPRSPASACTSPGRSSRGASSTSGRSRRFNDQTRMLTLGREPRRPQHRRAVPARRAGRLLVQRARPGGHARRSERERDPRDHRAQPARLRARGRPAGDHRADQGTRAAHARHVQDGHRGHLGQPGRA